MLAYCSVSTGCGPCRGFTPMLAKVFEDIAASGEQGFKGFRQVVSRCLGSHLVDSGIAIVDTPSIGNIASGAEDYDFGSDGGPEAVDQGVVYISCDERWQTVLCEVLSDRGGIFAAIGVDQPEIYILVLKTVVESRDLLCVAIGDRAVGLDKKEGGGLGFAVQRVDVLTG